MELGIRLSFVKTSEFQGWFEPTIKTNQEINDILKGQNIVRFIKKIKTKLARAC
jgi:hypothetical protein